ncbi:hypothetical protein LCGC14_2234930 [marine sediment metagenome]|uniref:Uncharacterized protein n=1 Tax=marine sediment metagenome TaxID=412755 RepID=A0A0F9D7D1_9ZZZZ
MLKGDASTTGKWVVLFNFRWERALTASGAPEKSFLRALAHFETEEDADIFYSYCLSEGLVPTKRPRFPDLFNS